MGQPAYGGRSVPAGHLLGGDGHLPVSCRAAAAVLDVNAQAGQAELGKPTPGLPLKLPALVGLLGFGRNLPVHKVTQRGLEHLLLFIEYQVRHLGYSSCALNPLPKIIAAISAAMMLPPFYGRLVYGRLASRPRTSSFTRRKGPFLTASASSVASGTIRYRAFRLTW